MESENIVVPPGGPPAGASIEPPVEPIDRVAILAPETEWKGRWQVGVVQQGKFQHFSTHNTREAAERAAIRVARRDEKNSFGDIVVLPLKPCGRRRPVEKSVR